MITTSNDNKSVTAYRKQAERLAKTRAATLVFDLESGDENGKNAEAAKDLTPLEVFDAVENSTPLNSNVFEVSVNGKAYELECYYPFLNNDEAFELLTDVKNSVECALVSQYESLQPDNAKVSTEDKVTLLNEVIAQEYLCLSKLHSDEEHWDSEEYVEQMNLNSQRIESVWGYPVYEDDGWEEYLNKATAEEISEFLINKCKEKKAEMKVAG